MGRSPCCEKIGLKKGPWTPEEDQKLLAYIEEHGHGSWRALPAKANLERCGKSCRLRWTNYLRPDIKRGKFSLQEEQTIIQLHALLGNRWSAITTHLPKRTDNEIKNYWNTHLKKRLAKLGIDPITHKPKNDSILSNDDGQSKNAANLSHMAQWESARLEAEARLVRQSKLQSVSVDSTQAQNSEFASTSSQLKKPMGRSSQSLNVLDTSNGRVWGQTNENAGASILVAGIGGDLESPSSTPSSAAGVGVTDGGNSIAFTAEGSQWGSQSVGGDSNSEHVPRLSFVENFTDLLLSTSSGLSLPEDGEDSNEGGGSGGGCGGDYYEDNNTYWNSILNIVNSSPTHSPIF